MSILDKQNVANTLNNYKELQFVLYNYASCLSRIKDISVALQVDEYFLENASDEEKSMIQKYVTSFQAMIELLPESLVDSKFPDLLNSENEIEINT